MTRTRAINTGPVQSPLLSNGHGGFGKRPEETDRPKCRHRASGRLRGGKDNFPADRQAAEQALAVFPHGRVTARQNRAFLHRVTRFLAQEAGIRQFLDVGTGIPTSPNLHEVAQGIDPGCRVVYADNDPIVLSHARALLTGTGEGRTAYLDADLREPEKILESAELRDTLDLTRPVALSVIALLHFIPDTDDPYGILRRYLDALPAGSYLALTHVTPDFAPDEVGRVVEIYRGQGIPATVRTRGEVERFFDGLDVIEPGVQPVHRWRPDDTSLDGPTDAEVNVYGALARIP
ncbi:S-adenosyl methyltransferase [Parafrankia irregularis]|uniref:S-adenosyl methyltransferase n=1 Tax=Parafrankia irregularis TaxID=795642 RepID=A0A0S4QWL3_9ACTN|nr:MULTISPECIES: SAM-dependent methyltransferase [Frankiaceae]CUU59748.1 S-adenosyl methyltransferase [Parafrankia irregularis]